MGKYSRKFLLLDESFHSQYGEKFPIPYGLECSVLESDGYTATIKLDENDVTLEPFESPALGDYKCLRDVIGQAMIILLCQATIGNRRVVEEIRHLRKSTWEKIESLTALKYEDPYFMKNKTHELTRQQQQKFISNCTI